MKDQGEYYDNSILKLNSKKIRAGMPAIMKAKLITSLNCPKKLTQLVAGILADIRIYISFAVRNW